MGMGMGMVVVGGGWNEECICDRLNGMGKYYEVYVS